MANGKKAESVSYSIGVDFGTASARMVILDLNSGEELAIAVVEYPHGVMDKTLYPTEEMLPPDWALQDPMDYLQVLDEGVPTVIAAAGIPAEEVVGLGIDFTACTVLPATEDGAALCTLAAWREHPHAWPKLWKHHAAQDWADRMTAVAEARHEAFLSRYGGRISSEWYFPKLLEIFAEDRPVYDAMRWFVEATDWVVWRLTGQLRRNACTAGYKALWSPDEGLPPADYFAAVRPDFDDPAAKLGTTFYPLGTAAGDLLPEYADRWGLSHRVAVAVGNVDAHVSVPGAGVSEPGALVMVIGTSICHLTVAEEEVSVPGMTGVVRDGILPGWYGYEAGQVAVGDMYAWFVDTMVPAAYAHAAQEAGCSLYEYLEQLATPLRPGQTGMIALDWWNGNRSILGDADLTGVWVGLHLNARPEALYRSLLESTAFGTRVIVDAFQERGVDLREIVACGGIAHKSPLLMQLYADICQLPVTVRASEEIPARGAALFGAVAAGRQRGGFETMTEASAVLASPARHTYYPRAEMQPPYDAVYQVYRQVYQVFGQSQPQWLHTLKHLRREALS